MIRKIVLCVLFLSLVVFADGLSDVREFFDSYVKDANSYSKRLSEYYSTDAKIIRVVIKPDGKQEKIIFNADDYLKQLKKRSKIARIVRYKNRYEDIKVTDLGDGKFKISALRYPMRDKKGLNFYFIVKDSESGFKVIEESMETTVQDFLKYAK